jgi:DNA-binding NtrC family response regulator
LHLRDADGLMVLERLRREGANVILVTSQGDIEMAVKAMQLARYQAQSLSEVERRHIERTLRHHGGNRTRAALELGISRATLINKIKQYGMSI